MILILKIVTMLAEREIKPKIKEMEERETIDDGLIKSLFENGLMGIEIERKWGGSEMSFTGALLAIEEISKVDPSVSVMVDVHNTLVNTVFSRYASERVKEAFLPRLATTTIGSFGLSEAASGSDAFALRTHAKKEGEGYLLNGQKMWISNSAEAGIFLIFATVDPTAGYKGITCFAVNKEQGIKIAKKEAKVPFYRKTNIVNQ